VAFGIWGALGGVGGGAAWVIGGPLVDGPGWEWIFYLNIPIGLLALALSPVLLGESRANTARQSYDPAGALTITGALVLLVYAVVEAPDTGWSVAQTILLFAGSATLLAAFGLIEIRHRAPSSLGSASCTARTSVPPSASARVIVMVISPRRAGSAFSKSQQPPSPSAQERTI
jgi:hypothetical protein